MHAIRLAAASAAALALLSLPAFAAGNAVTGELVFSDITLKVLDLDPSDTYLPSLTLRPAGSFDNTSSASVERRLLVDWSSEQDTHWTDPLPGGGLLSVGGAQATLGGAFSSVDAQEGAGVARIALRAGTGIPDAGTINTSINSVTLRSRAPSDPAQPGYSFTLGAKSQAVFSMRIDGGIRLEGIDGLDTIGGGLASWQITLKDARGGPDARTVVGSGDLGDISPTQQMSVGEDVSYSFLNEGTESLDVSLYFAADVQVWAGKAPAPAVPEPQAWLLALAGIGLAGGAARARRHAAKR